MKSEDEMPMSGGLPTPSTNRPRLGPTGESDRRRRFEVELAKVRLKSGVAERERRWLSAGTLLMSVGAATALISFVISLNLADTRDVLSMVVLAAFGLCLVIAGASLYLRHSLGRVLRLLVLRLLYEGQDEYRD